MAIRVRIRRDANKARIRLLRRLVIMAALVAFFCLSGTGTSLYLVHLPIMQSIITSFSFVPEIKEELPPELQQEQPRELDAGSAVDIPEVQVVAVDFSQEVQTSSDLIVSEIASDFAVPASDITSLNMGMDFAEGASAGQWGQGDGGSGVGRGNGDGGGGGKGRRTLGYNDDIQLVLALDASGSMNSLFEAVATSMDRVLTTLSNARLNGKKTSVHVGIVVYGQGAKNGMPFVLSKFTTNLNKLRDKLKRQACDGYNEECGRAIMFAVENFPWNRRERDDMLKVIFICGNESFNQGGVDYKKAIQTAVDRHIIINTFHCGEPNTEWENAAALGKGKGLCFNPPVEREPEGEAPVATASEEDAQERMCRALAELQKIRPMPTGSPAVQQALLAKANVPPKPAGKSAVAAWVKKYRMMLIRGQEWDIIEQCRREGANKLTLESIGGRGNLPLSLRGMSDDEALAAIRSAAEKRSELLKEYYSAASGADFGSQVLDLLKEQAATKGIDLRL